MCDEQTARPDPRFLEALALLATLDPRAAQRSAPPRNCFTPPEETRYEPARDPGGPPTHLDERTRRSFAERGIRLREPRLIRSGSFSFIYRVWYSMGGPWRDAVLELPRTAESRGGRRPRWKAVEGNARCLSNFFARGRTRYLPEPIAVIRLPGEPPLPVSLHAYLDSVAEIGLGRDGLLTWEPTSEGVRCRRLDSHLAGDLLAEIVASLVYHAERDDRGWTVPTDVALANGDFVVCVDEGGLVQRRSDGSPAVHVVAIRDLRCGVSAAEFLGSLATLTAWLDARSEDERYRDCGEVLVWRPRVSMSNAEVACEGLYRGLAYRLRERGAQRSERAIAQDAKRELLTYLESLGPDAKAPWLAWYDRALRDREGLLGQTPAFGERPGEGRVTLRDCIVGGLDLAVSGPGLVAARANEPASSPAAARRWVESYRRLETEVLARATIAFRDERAGRSSPS